MISAHGGTGGERAELSEENSEAVGANAIQSYIKNTLSGPANAKMLEDIIALKSVLGNVLIGGNFIITGCQAGLGARGIEFGNSLMELAGCRDINIFLNQDLLEKKYTYTAHNIPTGYACIVNYTLENGWGITGRNNFHEGWLKFTPNEQAKNVGNLQLNTSAPFCQL